jgi:hypothetical protein
VGSVTSRSARSAECERLFLSRDGGGGGDSDGGGAQIVSELLSYLDGTIADVRGLHIVAITNCEDKLDDAIMSRFVNRLEVNGADDQTKRIVITNWMHGFRLFGRERMSDQHMDVLVDLCGSDLRRMKDRVFAATCATIIESKLRAVDAALPVARRIDDAMRVADAAPQRLLRLTTALAEVNGDARVQAVHDAAYDGARRAHIEAVIDAFLRQDDGEDRAAIDALIAGPGVGDSDGDDGADAMNDGAADEHAGAGAVGDVLGSALSSVMAAMQKWEVDVGTRVIREALQAIPNTSPDDMARVLSETEKRCLAPVIARGLSDVRIDVAVVGDVTKFKQCPLWRHLREYHKESLKVRRVVCNV